MRSGLVLLLLGAILSACVSSDAATSGSDGDALLSSPDGRVALMFEVDEAGAPTYALSLNGAVLLEPSSLGLETTVGTWTQGLQVVDHGSLERVEDRYELLHGKASEAFYQANARVVTLENAEGRRMHVRFQLSDDGLAFRYEIPGSESRVTANAEHTGFRLPETARAWLTPMDHPETGFMNTNPSYEAHYSEERVGEASDRGVGWAFPALFEVDDTGWALISEAHIDGTFHASRLQDGSTAGHYRIGKPHVLEGTGPDDPVESTFDLPFASPWRVIIVGETLHPIVASTLVMDLSPSIALASTDWVKPGKVAWSWLPLKDEATVAPVQREFIDMAHEYGFEFVLVDALWDEQIGYDGIQELIEYGAERGVGLMLWYNSNGPYNEAFQTPRDLMYDREIRRAEFARIHGMGVRGVKVDFFGGDKQSVMNHYLDIIRDAAEFELMVNVHGATLPRGWNRTYPNFMTSEAVLGYEFITFDQRNADEAPRHSTIIPFVRNVVGPMDFTPTMLSDMVGGSERRTSDAFDLAMTVVFESGLQHLGVTPADMARQPEYVTEFLGHVPAAWDETRLIEGYPGTHVILARRKGNTWYVGGMNGETVQREVELDMRSIEEGLSGYLLRDGAGPREVVREDVAAGSPVSITMPPSGGFVAVFRANR